jgi:hypothetical protein
MTPSSSRATSILAWVAIAIAVIALLWEALAGGRALAPYDALGAFEPWASETDLEPTNPLLLDQPLVTMPWSAWSAERFAAGELPLWNPNNYLGQPIHAALTGAFMWPGHWPFMAWPDWRWLGLIAALELTLAGGFFQRFLRRLGASPLASTAGGIGYALCGFQVAWLGHPHTNAALLLPLALLSVERLCAARDTGRGGRREIALVALWTFGLGVCGHAQTALHVGLVVGAYALVRLWSGLEPRLGRAGLLRLVAGGVLGLLLAAPQILPFLEYVGTSRARTAFATTDVVTEVAPWKVAVMLVDPHFWGDPLAGTYRGPGGDNLNYSELVGGYVGRVLLVLAAIGAVVAIRRRDARRIALVVAAVVGACLAWQAPPFYDVARELPLLGSTKLMRFSLVLAAALAGLGAFGLDRLLQQLPRRPRALVGSSALLVVAVELVASGRGFNPTIEPERIFAPTPTSEFLAERGGRTLGTVGMTFAPNANLPLGVSLVGGYDSLEVDRVTDLVRLLSSAELEHEFISTIPYYDRAVPLVRALAIEHVVAREVLPAPWSQVFEGPGGLRVYSDPAPLGRAFLARGVERIDDADERLARLGAADFDPTVAVVESAVPAGVLLHEQAPGRADLVRDETDRLEIACEVKAPALLVVADAWYPGWEATVDGREVPIERVDHALRGVWLEPGDQRVEMTYRPGSFRTGLWLAAGAALVLAALLLLPRPKSTA